MRKTPNSKANLKNVIDQKILKTFQSTERRSQKNKQRFGFQNSANIRNSFKQDKFGISNFETSLSFQQKKQLKKNQPKTRKTSYGKSKQDTKKSKNKGNKITLKKIDENVSISKKLKFYKGDYFQCSSYQVTTCCIFHKQCMSIFYIQDQDNKKFAGLCAQCGIQFAKKQFDVKEFKENQKICENDQQQNLLQRQKIQIKEAYILRQNLFFKEKQFSQQLQEQNLFVKLILNSIQKVVNKCNKQLIEQIQKQITFKQKLIKNKNNNIDKILDEINIIDKKILNNQEINKKTIDTLDIKIKKTKSLISEIQFPTIRNFTQLDINQLQKQFRKIYENFIQDLFVQNSKSIQDTSSITSQDTLLALKDLKKNKIDLSSEKISQNSNNLQLQDSLSQTKFSKKNSFLFINKEENKNAINSKKLLNNVVVSRSYNFEAFEESDFSQFDENSLRCHSNSQSSVLTLDATKTEQNNKLNNAFKICSIKESEKINVKQFIHQN